MRKHSDIEISEKTHRMLEKLSKRERIPYNRLLQDRAMLVPEGDDEGSYAAGFRAKILAGMVDERLGRKVSLIELKREWV